MNENLEELRKEMDSMIAEQTEIRKSIGNVLEIQDILVTRVIEISTVQMDNDDRLETLKDLIVPLSEEIAKLKDLIK